MSIIDSLTKKLDGLDVGQPLSKKALILSYYPYIDQYTTRAFNKVFYDSRKKFFDKRFKSENNTIIRRIK